MLMMKFLALLALALPASALVPRSITGGSHRSSLLTRRGASPEPPESPAPKWAAAVDETRERFESAKAAVVRLARASLGASVRAFR